MLKIDWSNIHCVLCGQKRKNTSKNKIWYDTKLSDKSKGKMAFMCLNHQNRIHFVIEVFEVNDDISSVRNYVFWDKKP